MFATKWTLKHQRSETRCLDATGSSREAKYTRKKAPYLKICKRVDLHAAARLSGLCFNLLLFLLISFVKGGVS